MPVAQRSFPYGMDIRGAGRNGNRPHQCIQGTTLGLFLFDPAYLAVSYTHLDVYKRQVHIRSCDCACNRVDRGIFGDAARRCFCPGTAFHRGQVIAALDGDHKVVDGRGRAVGIRTGNPGIAVCSAVVVGNRGAQGEGNFFVFRQPVGGVGILVQRKGIAAGVRPRGDQGQRAVVGFDNKNAIRFACLLYTSRCV